MIYIVAIALAMIGEPFGAVMCCLLGVLMGER